MVCTPRLLVSTAVACQPGCMSRGRYKQRKVAADRAHRVAAESDARQTAPVVKAPTESGSTQSAPTGRVADGSSFRRPAPATEDQPSRPVSAPTAAHRRTRASTQWKRKTAQQSELRRLSEISKALVKLHHEEAKLIRERDVLIAELRTQGVGWSSLAMRTGLSRQALSKRIVRGDYK